MTRTTRTFVFYLFALFAGAVLALLPAGPIFAQSVDTDSLRERFREGFFEGWNDDRDDDGDDDDENENRGRGNGGTPPGWERRLPSVQNDPAPAPVVREPREPETPRPPVASSTPEEPEEDEPEADEEEEVPAVATTTSTSTGGAYTTPSGPAAGALAVIGETLFPSQDQVYRSNQLSPQASFALIALAALLGTGGLALLLPGLRMRNLVTYTQDSLNLAPRPAIRF
jgi:hypothetical protein